MGLFGKKLQEDIEQSIMPVAAVNEIISNRLPQLKTDKIFLKKDESCCYIDKAILNIHKTKRMSRHMGHTMPGLFKGTRFGTGVTKPIEYEEVEQQKGILYITNKRVVFQAPQNAFDKQHKYLSSIAPFSNAVVLQYGQKTYELIVANGEVINEALRIINS